MKDLLLKKIIAKVRRAVEMRKLNAEVTAYYNLFSEKERCDQAAWCELAEFDFSRSDKLE